MKPRVANANCDGIWAMAEASLAEALEAVARTGWPQHESDKLLARAAFDSWLRDAGPGHRHDPENLGDLIHAALVGLYDEPLLSALALLLLLDLYSEARKNGVVSGGTTH